MKANNNVGYLKKALLIIAGMFILAGCTYQANTKEFILSKEHKLAKLDKNKTVVYFYRPKFSHVAYSHNYIIKIATDDKIIGAAFTGGYFFVKLDPGIYIFQTRTTSRLERLSMKLEPGQVYYVRIDCDYENLVCDPVFTKVPVSQGAQEISNLTYAPLKD
ncbi:DUF2846 domain-containing protein [Desulfovulcanus sp.]